MFKYSDMDVNLPQPVAPGTETDRNTTIPAAIRYGLAALILTIALVILYFLSLRLISQVYLLRAERLSQAGYADTALRYLEKAVRLQPHEAYIYRQMGEICLKSGQSAVERGTRLSFLRKSGDFYRQAFRLNHLDAETAYGLAQAEAALEAWYRSNDPEAVHSPLSPLVYFRKALELRPNGVTCHYGLVQYLVREQKTDEVLPVIQNLVRIYPMAYNYLKKENFWSDQIRTVCIKGLQDAVNQENFPRISCTILSSLMAESENWEQAVIYYEKAMTYEAFQNQPGNYVYLGYLYLKQGKSEQAEKTFSSALSTSGQRLATLKQIYSYYKKAGAGEKFYVLFRRAEKNYRSSRTMTIFEAQVLFDLKKYAEARQTLDNLNRTSPCAEAFYWLARIAEMEKDWDAMELASQKATVFEPENSQYQQMFSGVLVRLKKLERAEEAASLAIKHLPRPSPWAFSNRAWIRWRRADYQGAFDDWRKAIALKPDHAPLYAWAAEAGVRLGRDRTGEQYYKKALTLDPENPAYRKRYAELRQAPSHSATGN